MMLVALLLLATIASAQHSISRRPIFTSRSRDIHHLKTPSYPMGIRYHPPPKINSPRFRNSILRSNHRTDPSDTNISSSQPADLHHSYESFESNLSSFRRRALSPYTLTSQVGVPSMIRDPFEHMYAGGFPLLRAPLRHSFLEYLQFLATCEPSWPCVDEVGRHFMMASEYGRVEVVEIFVKDAYGIVKTLVPRAIRVAENARRTMGEIEMKQWEWGGLNVNFSVVDSVRRDLDRTIRVLEDLE